MTKQTSDHKDKSIGSAVSGANDSRFTLLEGGLCSSIPDSKKRFMSAYVTNTRLMGVLALYARWSVAGGGDIHQFFYIDCEETGLESCKVYRGDWNMEMQMAEQALVGGLGAQKIPMSTDSRCLATKATTNSSSTKRRNSLSLSRRNSWIRSAGRSPAITRS